MPYFVYGSNLAKIGRALNLPTPLKMPASLAAFAKVAEGKFSLTTWSDKASSNFRKTPSPSAFLAVRC